MTDTPAVVAAWHDLVQSRDPEVLRGLLAKDVVFRSPAVFAPQPGVELTHAYLSAALAVLGPTIAYEHEWYDADSAVLEFHAVLDGLEVHGVDMVRWDPEDRIVEFTVMVRPLSALKVLVEHMGRQLTSGGDQR